MCHFLYLYQPLKKLIKDSTSAFEACQTSPREALPSYYRLRHLFKALQEAQPAAEGAAPHLLDQVEQQQFKIYTHIRDAVNHELSETLAQMKWPSKELRLRNETMAKWSAQVDTLLLLQEPDIRAAQTAHDHRSSPSELPVLLPLEAMVHSLQLRFRYHFYGNRPTNRLDKPEYFLSHIFDILDEHNTFLLQFLQPILDHRSQQTTTLDGCRYPDALSAFISALLPMVHAKTLELLPNVSSYPQLLSHLMHELMSFDATLRDSWAYAPDPEAPSEWKGLTWSVLVRHGYFETWRKVEKDFALSRYETIMATTDGREIDYESTDAGSTKPTKSAIRVNDLLESITERYRLLSSFSHKLRFLIDIQLEIFDLYHQRLRGSLEKYIMDTSTLGKVIQSSAASSQGSQYQNDLQGVFGLESLCKVFGSAEYLERKMSDWSDDVFFLELWDELQERASRNPGTNDTVGRDLTTSEVAAKTSATIKQSQNVQTFSDNVNGGGLFDETASAYRRLWVGAEEQIKQLLVNSVTASLRPYSKLRSWSSSSLLDTDNTAMSLDSSRPRSPSAFLQNPFHILSTHLSFLHPVLAPSPLRRVIRHLCLALQTYIWDNVLMRHHFSASGTAQLQADLFALQRVIGASTAQQQKQFSDAGTKTELGYEEAVKATKRLQDALTLLASLDTSRSSSTTSVSGPKNVSGSFVSDHAEDEDIAAGWGFDDEDEEENSDTIAESKERDMSSRDGDLKDKKIRDDHKSSYSSGNHVDGVPAQITYSSNENYHTPNLITIPTSATSPNRPQTQTQPSIEQRIYDSNSSARAVLAEMEITTLTESEARAVAGRRVGG